MQKKKTKRTKKEGNVVLSRGVLLKPNLGRERLVIPLSRSQHFLTPGRHKLKTFCCFRLSLKCNVVC